MNSTADQYQNVVPCGYVYNLTVNSNTSAMEGWCCGTTTLTGSDARDDRLLNATSAVSCNNGKTYLQIFNGTTYEDGFLCGLGLPGAYQFPFTETKNAANSLGPRWARVFLLISLLVHLFA
ncbi:LAQU0S17e02366g1_1 [Lachancea quebecensis]|uniref:LAQU0S17e02366g1_1 n=1 Tax=Lachancea quebecensis TaxID=1654605 RepID=A0A0P1KX11_9SACH|nr:LAQU0S17e02366g1_1 [Lachancea quebecensis]